MPRELRVLDGVHAGARAPVDGRLRIGSAPDNDIVLSDAGIAPHHAELAWDALSDRWTLQAPAGGGADAAASAQAHALGVPVTLGPVRLTVAAANDPFELPPVPVATTAPDAQSAHQVEVAASDRPAAPASQAPAAVGDQAPAAAADDRAAAGSTTDAATPAVRATSPAGLPMRAALLLGAVVLLVLLAGAAVLYALAPAASPAPVAPVAAPAAPSPGPVQAALQAQGLGGRLQVRVDAAARRVVVEGVLADDEALEQLGLALARLNPRPAMRVATVAQLRGALRDTTGELPEGLVLHVSDAGDVLLQGAVADPALLQAVQQRLRAMLPAAVALRSEVALPDDLAARFIAQARAAGFALDGRLDGRTLRLSGRIAAADIPRWEQWIVAFGHRHAGVLRFAVEVQGGDAAPAAAVPPIPGGQAWRVPFAIRSVVGGAEAYVVLGDGTRLMPGGQHAGVRLLQVGDAALVFETAGRQVTVPR